MSPSAMSCVTSGSAKRSDGHPLARRGGIVIGRDPYSDVFPIQGGMESARRIHLSRRRVEGKPFCAINLGKDRMTTGSRRPLHFECTALERCRIKVAFTGESVNDLAPLLLDRRERYKQAARLDPESSSNSRFAASKRSSSAPTSPFGMDHAPPSLFLQNGPPGCTSNTSAFGGIRRNRRMPADVRAIWL